MHYFYTIKKGVAFFPELGYVEFIQYPHYLKIINGLEDEGSYPIYLYQYGDARNLFRDCGRYNYLCSLNNRLVLHNRLDQILRGVSLDDLIGRTVRIGDQYAVVAFAE